MGRGLVGGADRLGAGRQRGAQLGELLLERLDAASEGSHDLVEIGDEAILVGRADLELHEPFFHDASLVEVQRFAASTGAPASRAPARRAVCGPTMACWTATWRSRKMRSIG